MKDIAERSGQITVTANAIRSAVDAMGDPNGLIARLRSLADETFEQGVGSRIAGNIRTGDATICDLLVAALWLTSS